MSEQDSDTPQKGTPPEVTEDMVAEGISAFHDWNELDGLRALVTSVYERMRDCAFPPDANTRG